MIFSFCLFVFPFFVVPLSPITVLQWSLFVKLKNFIWVLLRSEYKMIKGSGKVRLGFDYGLTGFD